MKENAVILFDGVCNLCNGAVKFVIRHDKNAYFKFAPLQSEIASRLVTDKNLSRANTFLLFEQGKLYKRSTAALRVCLHLNGAWKLLYGLIIVPGFIRDALYDIVAKNRTRWFGKKDACMIPSDNLRSRFLNQ